MEVYKVQFVYNSKTCWFFNSYSSFGGGGRVAASIFRVYVQGDTKERELLKNPTKIEEIQEKKILTENEPLQLAF